jgi:transposase
MVDIDESNVQFGDCQRRYGHSFSGHPARYQSLVCSNFNVNSFMKSLLQSSREGVSLNIVLAVSPTLGVVAFMVYPGTMNNHVFYSFLRLLVLPALSAGSPKFVMVDNHRAHRMNHIRNLVTGQGHVYQFRPTHSPDFAPVELCFAQIKAFIKTHEHLITPSTLVEWVTYAINKLTAAEVRKYFAHSHYLVTGETYKPYLGGQ